MPIELRAITEDEHPEFHVVEASSFGYVPTSGDQLAEDRTVFEYDRTIAAFDDGRIVATACAFSFDMTVPGGAAVPVAAVSSVGVAGTHRRQGLLRRMMQHQLDDVAARGESMAILNASEAGIYGRFGYGLAQLFQTWKLDTIRSTFAIPVRDDLRLRMVPKGEAAPVLAPIYDAWRRTRPGAVTQSDAWWTCVLSDHVDWRGGGPLLVVVCDPTETHAGGYASYVVDRDDAPPGKWKMTVRELVAADDEVRARLWRFLLDVDLVGTVTVEAVPLDDPLRWRLRDPRQVQTIGVRDFVYVRIVDIPAALEARAYEADGDLLLAVDDPFRPATSGTYRVTATGGAATVARTDDPASAADLALDIADLGSLYLGGVTATELARAGRITEHRPGALTEADRLFKTSVAPFCITRF